MTKNHQNALVIFCRTPIIVRDNLNVRFAALPWDDIDALSTAFVGDVLMTASRLEATDILVYRNPEELSDDYFAPFRHMVQLFDVHDRMIADQVEQAIDHAFHENYSRVAVLLDNNP